VRRYHRKAIAILAAASFVFALAVVATGDSSGQYVARYEPIKFAAMENVAHTTAGADLSFFGVDLPQPHGLLSWLADRDSGAVVRGLDAFDPSQWPPLWIHGLFDSMALIGVLVTLVPTLFLLLLASRRTRRIAYSRAVLWSLFACGILAAGAVELGWMLTEIGRQPYAIRGIMTSAQAFTTSQHVIEFGYIFPSMYIVLFIVTPCVLVRHFRKNKLDLSVDHFAGEKAEGVDRSRKTRP
jgi:cytochrome d ubiquinol oxidase subunit I